MSEQVPIRYAISIAHFKDRYHAIIHCPSDNVYTQSSSVSLAKLMTQVSKRLRKKEKTMNHFPLPTEESLIVLPNGA